MNIGSLIKSLNSTCTSSIDMPDMFITITLLNILIIYNLNSTLYGSY